MIANILTTIISSFSTLGAQVGGWGFPDIGC